MVLQSREETRGSRRQVQHSEQPLLLQTGCSFQKQQLLLLLQLQNTRQGLWGQEYPQEGSGVPGGIVRGLRCPWNLFCCLLGKQLLSTKEQQNPTNPENRGQHMQPLLASAVPVAAAVPAADGIARQALHCFVHFHKDCALWGYAGQL